MNTSVSQNSVSQNSVSKNSVSLLSQRLYTTPNFKDYKVVSGEFGEGTYNTIKLIKYSDNYKCILRSPKRDQEDSQHEFLSENVVSCFNTKLMSEIVTQNQFPNFPILYSTIHIDTSFLQMYETIIEYANCGTLYESINKHPSNLVKQIIVQSILGFYYMNNTLSLSHNDSTTSNILIKNIVPQNLCYKINDSKYINIFTDKLAIISDNDKITGTQTTISKDYIFGYYLRNIYMYYYRNYKNQDITINGIRIRYLTLQTIKVSVIDDNDITVIKQLKVLYNKISENKRNLNGGLKLDLTILLMQIIPSTKSRSLAKKCMKFLNSYILKNKSVFWCIEKYFNDVCSITNTIKKNTNKNNIFSLHSYKLNFESLNYKNNERLYVNIINHEHTKGHFLHHFFNREFRFNRFFNDKLIDDDLTIFKKESDLLNKIKKYCKDDMTVYTSIIKLSNFIIKSNTEWSYCWSDIEQEYCFNREIAKSKYPLLLLVCAHIFEKRMVFDFDLILSFMTTEKYEYIIYKMLRIILKTLNDTK